MVLLDNSVKLLGQAHNSFISIEGIQNQMPNGNICSVGDERNVANDEDNRNGKNGNVVTRQIEGEIITEWNRWHSGYKTEEIGQGRRIFYCKVEQGGVNH